MKYDPLDIYKPLKPVIDISSIKVYKSDYDLIMAIMEMPIGDICFIDINAETNNLLCCKKGKDGIVRFYVTITDSNERTSLIKLKSKTLADARLTFRSIK